ncbi:MAG: protein-L-isoaspartate O-methyltransferase [Candidatus Pacebacteria bacterium]|nr:protein-L-isoaspartate O-methyltransferase [Candidatus Paceibacterota bacterium]
MNLIDSLIKDNWLKTPLIIEAFRKIKRADFLPEGITELAELNEAIPIGFGQTISQPLVVAFMIEQLNPRPGHKILDIGSGSGWTTALLSYIVGSKSEGKVIALEIVPELKEFGEENASKYDFIKKGIAEFISIDGSFGYLKKAPYDGIIASASSQIIPEPWKEQLKIGGRIVAPVKSSIWVLEKKSEREFIEAEYPGFSFVPLVSK